MNAHSLKNAFLTNSVSDFFFRNSEKVSSYLFSAGNVGLIFKPALDVLREKGVSSLDDVTLATQTVLQPNLETAAGLMFLASSMVLRLSKKHPTLAFQVCGACVIAGAALLSASGIDFDTQQIAEGLKNLEPSEVMQGLTIKDGWKVASPLIGYVPSALLILLQDGISKVASGYTDSKNFLGRSFAKVARYPIVTSALLDSTGNVGLLKSAINTDDPVMGAIAAAWMVGAGGLMACDPRAQEAYHAAKAEKHEL